MNFYDENLKFVERVIIECDPLLIKEEGQPKQYYIYRSVK